MKNCNTCEYFCPAWCIKKRIRLTNEAIEKACREYKDKKMTHFNDNDALQ